MNTKKGDSRHGGGVKRLLVLSLLAGCGPVTLSVTAQAKLTSQARLAENECQRHCNASDGDRCDPADDACLNLARTWLHVGVSK